MNKICIERKEPKLFDTASKKQREHLPTLAEKGKVPTQTKSSMTETAEIEFEEQ